MLPSEIKPTRTYWRNGEELKALQILGDEVLVEPVSYGFYVNVDELHPTKEASITKSHASASQNGTVK